MRKTPATQMISGLSLGAAPNDIEYTYTAI